MSLLNSTNLPRPLRVSLAQSSRGSASLSTALGDSVVLFHRSCRTFRPLIAPPADSHYTQKRRLLRYESSCDGALLQKIRGKDRNRPQIFFIKQSLVRREFNVI